MHQRIVTPESLEWERRGVVGFIRWMGRQFSTHFHHLKVPTPYPLPETQAAIIACNHISGLDPALVQTPVKRLITWMMAKEYYEQPGIEWFFNRIKAIPVGREGRDLAATRAALRALKDGHVLGVFPEGKISTTDEFLPFQTGIGLLALKSGAPVVPAYIEGTQRNKEMLEAIFVPNDVTLRFGQPLRFADTETMESVTEKIQRAIEDLRRIHRAAAAAI